MRFYVTATVRLLVLSVFLISSPLIASFAAGSKCGMQMETELSRLEIDRDTISEISTVNIYSRSGAMLERLESWVSFNNCKGNLVLEFNRQCQIGDVYTTYSCSIPGVKNY